MRWVFPTVRMLCADIGVILPTLLIWVAAMLVSGAAMWVLMEWTR